MPQYPEKPAPPEERLTPRQEAYLKASKEIVVKFIESGRLSSASFPETFGLVYRAVRDTVEEKV
jgi:hypothetical protein